MDIVDPVSAVSGGGALERAAEMRANSAANLAREAIVEMRPPSASRSDMAEPMSRKLWSQLDDLSGRLAELHDTKAVDRVPLSAPARTGDYVTDMQASMVKSHEFQVQLLDMQMKIGRAGNVFNIGVAMAQSVQNSVQTLFKDK